MYIYISYIYICYRHIFYIVLYIVLYISHIYYILIYVYYNKYIYIYILYILYTLYTAMPYVLQHPGACHIYPRVEISMSSTHQLMGWSHPSASVWLIMLA